MAESPHQLDGQPSEFLGSSGALCEAEGSDNRIHPLRLRWIQDGTGRRDEASHFHVFRCDFLE